uniref:LysR transcriptional regulator n=2 Tax=Sphingobium phenoxybenzoativorans TaxID=1592790 RepID=A0A1W5YR10_9SPHN|nr:LysR transcriptional regulator [Sphingobium phenoxybenzoativorans]
MVGRQFELTKKGESLVSQVEQACREVESLFGDYGFDPCTARRKFVIGTADYVAFLLAPILSSILQDEAPNIAVQFFDITSMSRFDLAQGRIDVVIIPSDAAAYLEGESNSAPLFKDEMVVIASKGRHQFPDGLTREIFENSRHARFKFYWDAPAHQDIALKDCGLAVQECILVQQFSLLPSIVEKSDSIALIYRSLADVFVRLHNIEVFDPPFAISTSTVTAYWWNSKDKDPAHRWFRGLLARASAELGLDVGG